MCKDMYVKVPFPMFGMEVVMVYAEEWEGAKDQFPSPVRKEIEKHLGSFVALTVHPFVGEKDEPTTVYIYTTSLDFSSIAHEAVHASSMMLDHIDDQASHRNDEVPAHIVGYICGVVETAKEELNG